MEFLIYLWQVVDSIVGLLTTLLVITFGVSLLLPSPHLHRTLIRWLTSLRVWDDEEA